MNTINESKKVHTKINKVGPGIYSWAIYIQLYIIIDLHEFPTGPDIHVHVCIHHYYINTIQYMYIESWFNGANASKNNMLFQGQGHSQNMSTLSVNILK